MAKERLKEYKNVICKACDINKWIEKDKKKYGAIIAIWLLCYMDEKSVEKFLSWAKEHSEYIILVEPI